jgi:site-specific recombinase XerD
MLLPIKPICKAEKIRRDGTSLIFIQYCFNSEKRTVVNSEIAIPPEYWNRRKLGISSDLPKQFGNAEELNEKLEKMIRIAQDIIFFAAKKKLADPVTFLKNNFKPEFDTSSLGEKHLEIVLSKPKMNLDLYFQIDDYIKQKRKSVTPNMLNVYNNLRDTLKAFENFRKKPITFEYNFYEEFVEYMTFEHIQRRRKKIIKGFKRSSIGKTIKQLRIFLKNRMRKKIISEINLDDYKIIDEESDAIYLNQTEIELIYKVNLSRHQHLMNYRDIFILGCFTGLRFSDFSIINKDDIRNGMLYKKQNKSDHWVVIPLRSQAYHIIMNLLNKKFPILTNTEFNRHIKTIGKLAGINELIRFSYKKGNKDIVTVKPKYEWITSHTCRRSFCTNEFLSDTPVELIMKISGHKSLKDFYRYIKITPEEAGQKIKKLWEKRGEMTI